MSIFATLTSWENLLLAYRDASRGKRRQSEVAAFEHRLEDRLSALRSALLAKSYRPSAYSSFFIHEPKRRLISAAPFRDRVVHHALVQVIEPAFERSFIADTYANRKGKGTHRALDRCQHLARRFPFVLQLDLRQFFPSIDHQILRGILAAKIQDESVLWLIDRVLESGEGVLSEAYDMVYRPGDDLFAINRPRGLPIGNLTSQFWGNVILSPIDHSCSGSFGLAATCATSTTSYSLGKTRRRFTTPSGSWSGVSKPTASPCTAAPIRGRLAKGFHSSDSSSTRTGGD